MKDKVEDYVASLDEQTVKDLYEKITNIPKFKIEDEEREFWSKIDLGEHFEASDLKRVSFPNLKPMPIGSLRQMPWIP